MNSEKGIIDPFSQPMYITTKPVGDRCNMRCSYCYRMLNGLSEQRSGRKCLEERHIENGDSKTCMSDTLLEAFTREYIESQTGNEVLFVWHGGEPTLCSLDFYRKAVLYQKIYGRGKTICNCLQTNGILLDSEWCKFLKEENWLLGLSIDGTKEMHAKYRQNNAGDSMYESVLNAVRMMQYWKVEWNAMVTVHQGNVGKPIELYRYLKGLGARFIQFSPVVERIRTSSPSEHSSIRYQQNNLITPETISAEQWGHFLINIFDEWIKYDVGEVFINLFDSTLANWMGIAPSVCILAKDCGHAGVMEMNGDIYGCDHLEFPEYKLGNIKEQGLLEMMYGDKQQNFRTLKRNSLTQQCKECKWLFACHGECPRNRFSLSNSGEVGHNYLCKGYHDFFEYVAPDMYMMKKLIESGHDASDIMNLKYGNSKT